MNLSDLFIKRPITTTLIMLGICVFGAMAYRLLPVSDLPVVDFPTISVNASLPGASPETVASAVTLPLWSVDEYAQSMLAQRISMVNGVAQVDVLGAAKYAVRIDVDPRKLSAHAIGIDEVTNAIVNNNVNLPTGTMFGPDKTFTVM